MGIKFWLSCWDAKLPPIFSGCLYFALSDLQPFKGKCRNSKQISFAILNLKFPTANVLHTVNWCYRFVRLRNSFISHAFSTSLFAVFLCCFLPRRRYYCEHYEQISSSLYWILVLWVLSVLLLKICCLTFATWPQWPRILDGLSSNTSVCQPEQQMHESLTPLA